MVLHTLMHVTNILSWSGQRHVCDVETGPHAHGWQDVSQGLNIPHLRGKTFGVSVSEINFSISMQYLLLETDFLKVFSLVLVLINLSYFSNVTSTYYMEMK